MVPDRTGQVIGGRYQVLETVGHGGQSVVYRARDLRDGDEVALKILKGEFANDSSWRERMAREAAAMASLRGTAAIQIYDQQFTQDGALALVMEFLHGNDLDHWLAAIEAHGRRIGPREVIPLLEPVIYTLEAAHQQGIVHRDLKPSNIFILSPEHGGGVRLLDFGFAKFTRLRGLTMENMVAGSPSYIAPESWMGKRDIDHRVDIYALGAMIFRCLTGRTPFEAKDLVTLMKAVTAGERPSLHALRPDMPKQIDDWVQQALAIDPNARFVRLFGMWQAFRGIVGV